MLFLLYYILLCLSTPSWINPVLSRFADRIVEVMNLYCLPSFFHMEGTFVHYTFFLQDLDYSGLIHDVGNIIDEYELGILLAMSPFRGKRKHLLFGVEYGACITLFRYLSCITSNFLMSDFDIFVHTWLLNSIVARKTELYRIIAILIKKVPMVTSLQIARQFTITALPFFSLSLTMSMLVPFHL